ncbi:MAG: hypothetical protein ACLS9Q_07970 [[Clostridium] scindens]|uniref:hypothetical protein n=1 Tax=Clostridium scindens (strain JCM 10418 / VPI 12708) TaxID=29347 RepID=UPI0039926555
MANRQIFQHEEDLLINDECKLLEDDTNNKTKMFKLVTLKNFIGEFIKEKIPSWEYGSLKTKGKNLIESANEIYDTTQKRMVSMEEIDLVTEEGFFVDALAVKELNRKLPACNEIYTGVANHAQYDIPDITPYDLLVIYGGPGTYANTSVVIPVESIVYKDDGQFALGVHQSSTTFWELEFNFPTSTKINIANYKNQSWTTPAIRKILAVKL